ncbi:hypothetical protein F2P81_025864 [Scophthalmus maximus]|nr:hypothetical protein F2P81_025864 [Scophthalmus maximus]
MEGLPEGIFPTMTSKKMAMAVVKELRAKFGKKLKYMLFLEDLGVEAVLTECFQSHIQKSSYKKSCRCCKYLLYSFFITLGAVAILAIGTLFLIL